MCKETIMNRIKSSPAILAFSLFAFSAACGDDDGADSNGTGTQSSTDSSGSGSSSVDTSGTESGTPGECMSLPTDFVHGTADIFPACISDDGIYHLAASEAPGSVARVIAYEAIADLTWRSPAPVASNFLNARSQYELEQGIASRVGRREDLHYPEIPKDQQDSNVDWDKQCSIQALAEAYPDRCPGPEKIGPIISEAFIASQTAGADLLAISGRLRGALDWFFYLSVHKEAFTCFQIKAADCDSAWAYYNGGAVAAGSELGFAKALLAISPEAHQKIFEGLLAVRCVRDLYDGVTYPTFESLPPEAKTLFNNAWEQLDNALHRGYALVLHSELMALAANPSDVTRLAYVRVAGPVLDREAIERGASAQDQAALTAAWTAATPTAETFTAAAAALESVFPCSEP
jgi:hypothetical protein